VKPTIAFSADTMELSKHTSRSHPHTTGLAFILTLKRTCKPVSPANEANTPGTTFNSGMTKLEDPC